MLYYKRASETEEEEPWRICVNSRSEISLINVYIGNTFFTYKLNKCNHYYVLLGWDGTHWSTPQNCTRKFSKYVVTLVDYFTKWTEAAALPDKTAEGVALFLYAGIIFISKFGAISY